MTDVLAMLNTLARPRLLMEAVRHGAPNYRRETHLRRLLKQPVLPGPNQAAMRLMLMEQEYNECRQAGAAEYSVLRHVEVLIALSAEAGALLAREAQEKASATSAFLRIV